MTAGFLDRTRAARLMEAAGLDALLLCRPDSLRHATGAFPGVATLFGRAGAAFALVPADLAAPMAAVVGDLEAEGFRTASGLADVRTHPIWVETARAMFDETGRLDARRTSLGDRASGFARPETFDPALALAALRDLLTERGLSGGRLGLELGFVSAADLRRFEAALPGVTFVDATEIAARLRMVKHPTEIAHLREAAELTVAGLARLRSELREGLSAPEIAAIWRGEVVAEARRRDLREPLSSWAYVSVGPDGFAPGGPARLGDIVKIDVGAVVAGYSADMARTAVIGPMSAAQAQVHEALLGAFEAGLAALRPGRPLCEAHHAATKAMQAAGFEGFSRGHFGHGLGAGVFSEEWPFISADCEVEAEPGMMLAFETPYYVRGLGGFIIEDQFLVTPDGLECLSPLPRGLWVIPPG
ncbi:M24 family metallopeptidase [Aureimonas pseudogalii]|uniref:Xaa-Pro aminopeptidase n=1 Tax=Aureimonas pseudogalii TaxID=1744844 RepID=A0A7W6E7V5_9HYPH|nr:Xaa-Pro peptidase family protein [Aureimonas pseudogalii]MBB3996352.1 Xaa-Pro aminopeptidase [Aureimonas pseudogalii]